MDETSRQKILDIVQSRIEQMAFLRWLGVRIHDIQEGRADVLLPIRKEMLQIAGLLHGGVTASVIDVAGALAAMSALEHFSEIRTLNLTTHFLHGVREGVLFARALCIHVGRQTALTEVHVYHSVQNHFDADTLHTKKKVAFGTVTFSIIPRKEPLSELLPQIQL